MKFPKSIVLLSAAFVGCGYTAENRKLDAKVEGEKNITTRQELAQETEQTFQQAPLSAEQKQQLNALRERTRSEIKSIRDQSLQLRAVLAKDLVATPYDDNQVDIIKRRLQSLSNDELKTTFRAIDDANKIIGNRGTQHEDYMKQILEL